MVGGGALAGALMGSGGAAARYAMQSSSYAIIVDPARGRPVFWSECAYHAATSGIISGLAGAAASAAAAGILQGTMQLNPLITAVSTSASGGAVYVTSRRLSVAVTCTAPIVRLLHACHSTAPLSPLFSKPRQTNAPRTMNCLLNITLCKDFQASISIR
jgi:hypothetical protein